MKWKRILALGGAMFLGVAILALDVVRSSVDIEIEGLLTARDILVLTAFFLLYLFLELSEKTRIEQTVKKLGLILVLSVVVTLVTTALLMFTTDISFEAKEGFLNPLSYKTVFAASFLNLGFSLLALLIFRFLRDLILYKRRRGTRRNLIILVVLMAATAASTMFLRPVDSGIVTSVLFGTAVIAMVANSFRLSWIVYLSKREKVFGLIYAFLLFGTLTVLNVMTQTGLLNQILLYYSHPLKEIVGQTLLFGNIYAGMAFVSTLFHLPTAEAFEKKTTEISSLHTLGKLVTRVFDFNELLDTVTTMTLQVCEAKACWIEIVHQGEGEEGKADPGAVYEYRSKVRSCRLRVAGLRNIRSEEIELLLPFGESSMRDEIFLEPKPVVVDDIAADERINTNRKKGIRQGSMVVVPLLSHDEVIGILYAIKDTEQGFFKDDVDVVSAFADQATIAIENSRLIDKSLERERLMREMMLAQEMQKRLLPQSLPIFPTIQLDAVSTPAFEVGGDYYDVVQLEKERIGIVVGDVSGKGLSAAFYMSEVKGIFQSLSRIHSSPGTLLERANDVLSDSIDRRSFISLIYAVVDTRTGKLTLSRAGHCPMLHVSGNDIRYVRPSGMGLGLSRGKAFSDSIQEETLQLKPGDSCVFYTDGLTEARNGDDEFGYERLIDCARDFRNMDATGIKQSILGRVQSFSANQSLHDDLTLLVLKWVGKP
ncbi:MAG: SpoIIE family protein phosphatase [Ignavibacteria bacterium]|nr:SpoIIE family protein phosphatase [Ignavibacteria bacterium]